MALAQQRNLGIAAQRFGGKAIVEGIGIVDDGAVDADDHVAGLDAGARGRAGGCDIRHQGAARALEAETVGNLRRHLLQLGAEPRPFDRGAAALGGGHHHAHHIGGDGKADALRAAGARIDRGVDADQPAVEVDQRAAGIAGIDGGVGLDEELIIADADLGARQRRDDAVRHGLADAERIADRQHHVADLQVVGIGEVEHREFFVDALQAQDGEIAVLVLEHDLGVELALVGQRDLHFAGALDHVVIGDDEARRIDDDAGAERAHHLLARHRAEELAEQRIVHERVAVLDDPRGIDVDHGGRHPPDHGRKRQLDLRQ